MMDWVVLCFASLCLSLVLFSCFLSFVKLTILAHARPLPKIYELNPIYHANIIYNNQCEFYSINRKKSKEIYKYILGTNNTCFPFPRNY